MSNNGPSFTNAEFQEFVDVNGITHLPSAPYHPGSNGLAERSVQTFKEGMKKLKQGSIESKVARFLFKYRITPPLNHWVSTDGAFGGKEAEDPS